MSEYKSFEVERHDAVVEVYLNRPEKRNAMGLELWDELPELFSALDFDHSVRAIIIGGRGKMFCAGLDLTSTMSIPGLDFGDQKPEGRIDLAVFVRKWQDALTAIERCRKPVIAAIHGGCIGGGLDLASACDIRLASRDAFFSLREAAMAMVADLGSLQRLPLIIGQGLTRELAFTARDVPAEEAKEMRLVNHVYDDQDAMMKAAREMAEQIAAQAPLAVQSSKQVLNYSRHVSVEDGLHYAVIRNSMILPSGELLEAMQAFMEKRKPKF
ncbi:MAG TPA: crotonase/enoyl-CoA hydratase family protein [Myxococcales bacterium]|nr:enoyl-CoA hydratase [Deltaproteobacteria bacterium]HAA57794.1 crotonase/enoyl-CoA hydratase family protein [Myxococcales bacterium]|tara:strand:- start:24340 stop:25149 length:810 start_codon:yes stop_codon:yes gene_type:complete